eukprot:c6804_g1_i1.p1 GENE.c6804_g1_i1~~c6804_g1_i1.p1  ORF type:complete len:742 (+),score=89.36 c6804_g1_i1:184-2409(+)
MHRIWLFLLGFVAISLSSCSPSIETQLLKIDSQQHGQTTEVANAFANAENIFTYSGTFGSNAYELRLTCPIEDITNQVQQNHHDRHTRYIREIDIHKNELVAVPSPEPTKSFREDVLSVLFNIQQNHSTPSPSPAEPLPVIGARDSTALMTAPNSQLTCINTNQDDQSCSSSVLVTTTGSDLSVQHATTHDLSTCSQPTRPSDLHRTDFFDSNRSNADETFLKSKFGQIFFVSILSNLIVLLVILKHYGPKFIKTVATPRLLCASTPIDDIPPLTDALDQPALGSPRKNSRKSSRSTLPFSNMSHKASFSVEQYSDVNTTPMDTADDDSLRLTNRPANDSSNTTESNQSLEDDDQFGSGVITPISNPLKSKFFAPSETSSPSVSVATQSVQASFDSQVFLYCDGRYESEFQQIRRLGNGGFGNVFQCRNKLTNVHYAIKKVPVEVSLIRHSEARILDDFALREVTISAVLNHPNVVRYITAWLQSAPANAMRTSVSEMSLTSFSVASSVASVPTKTPKSYLFIQMELCEGGTLSQYLSFPQRQVYLPKVLDSMRQALAALDYIHSSGFIHRDIKPSNMFFDKNVLKIGDFGCSRNVYSENQESELLQVPSNLNHDEFTSFTSGIGTSVYGSPEQLAGSRYDAMCDVYSLGIVFFEMLHPPFGTVSERAHVLTRVRNGEVDSGVSKMFPRETLLIKRMVSKNPQERPTVKELIAHVDKWIKELNPPSSAVSSFSTLLMNASS